ncbi:uncharacterized protein LOC122962699 [Acropora millepora]|uniref:uncharacterized protein LOC122962699 n=1 Tax=Acropora millepora TaxID=45264 RepID=UPI001CF29FD6|nr:uncharacterized protein LOC122962699 [Acropora millepora]
MAVHFFFLSNFVYTCLVFLGKDVTVFATEATYKGAVQFSDGNFITYANFVPFYNHKLNYSLSETRMVNGELDCIETCSDNDSCLSANFKTTPEANNKFVCEVLTTNKFITYKLFVPALGFNHYSFTSPCEHNPCKNGGTCFEVNHWRDFRCDCLPSTRGRTCSEEHYSNCVQLRDAGINNTGQHTLQEINKPLPAYCDQDYMGGGWLMVFKVGVNNKRDIEEMWSSNKGYNINKSEIINVHGSVQFFYKSRRVNDWESSLKPKEARLALYDNRRLVLSLVFNATDSNNTSWFSKNRLIQSPWTEDLQNQQQNFFSLVGDLTARRAFFINKVYNSSCSGDNGWLMATSGKNCSYENRSPQRKAFLYSKLNTSVNWEEHENVGSADVLAVFIR